MHEVKNAVKKVLAFFGLYHPSLGIKIHPPKKASVILEYKTPALRIFVETGTEFGTMINMIGDKFEKVYSIELNTELFEKAKELYKGNEKIQLLHGDSANEIKKVLTELQEPAIFWLDAHGPGDMSFDNSSHCPAEKELEAIFGHAIKRHVILIDDARKFDLKSIARIKSLAKANGYACTIKDGLFRLFPEQN